MRAKIKESRGDGTRSEVAVLAWTAGVGGVGEGGTELWRTDSTT